MRNVFGLAWMTDRDCRFQRVVLGSRRHGSIDYARSDGVFKRFPDPRHDLTAGPDELYLQGGSNGYQNTHSLQIGGVSPAFSCLITKMPGPACQAEHGGPGSFAILGGDVYIDATAAPEPDICSRVAILVCTRQIE